MRAKVEAGQAQVVDGRLVWTVDLHAGDPLPPVAFRAAGMVRLGTPRDHDPAVGDGRVDINGFEVPVMTKGRLEAFSDGVLAIIITIMVLELQAAAGSDARGPAAADPGVPSLPAELRYVGIYWNNHHHMFHAVDASNGAVLWANLHLLFWLSLIPFVTAWMGESDSRALPIADSTALILLAGGDRVLILHAVHRCGSRARTRSSHARSAATGRGELSVVFYIAAVAVAMFEPCDRRRTVRRGGARLDRAGPAHRATLSLKGTESP